MATQYIPPAVWTWEQANGGELATTNRPIAGATHDQALPGGQHRFQLYSLATPNGVKVTILFEELLEQGIVEAEYDAFPIKISDGEQFGSGFVDLNPNAKIPALYDRKCKQKIFESGSILVYLADMFKAFLPAQGKDRTDVFNWLFWQVGSAPFLGGGFGHFYAYAPEQYQYPINRFAMEVKRQLDVLDKQLAVCPYIAGAQYSIADMAIWPWYGVLVQGKLYAAGEFLDVKSYRHVVTWAEKIAQRPAVQRGRIVNRLWGEPAEQLPERHSGEDFTQ